MAETTDFELVSPEKLLLQVAAEMVVVPGTEGDFGAMPRHAPLLSGVRPGVIALYQDGKVQQRIFVAGGFAEVTETRVTVLAEEAIPVSELTTELVQTRRGAALDGLAAAATDPERRAASRQLLIAEAMAAALA